MPSDHAASTTHDPKTAEPPMTRMYVAVIVVQVLVLLALWTFQQYFSR